MAENERVAPERAASVLRGKRVLVTGGGFIGSRLVEVLVRECAADVVVLVRRPESGDRFAGLACEVVVGDVTDRVRVAEVVAGCDTVFHCAYGTSGSQRHRRFVNQEGTRRVLEAAAAAGVRRVVHLSTFMTYGRTADGDLTEDCRRNRFGSGYADSKLAGERIAVEFGRSGRAPVVVLQPTNVYGPHGGVWVEDVLHKLRSGIIPLVDNGTGTSNHVYVDDVVQAALLAAVASDDTIGECFLVSSGELATWREFYGRFEEILGARRTVGMSVDQAHQQWRQAVAATPRLHRELLAAVHSRRLEVGRVLKTRELQASRTFLTAVLPESWQDVLRRRMPSQTIVPADRNSSESSAEPPVHVLTPAEIAFFASRARVRIEKAEKQLGFRPAVTLDEGICRTADWARDHGLLVVEENPLSR